MLVTKQLALAIDLHNVTPPLWTSEVNSNCLVTNILQNILFCTQQKNEPHTGLEQVEGE